MEGSGEALTSKLISSLGCVVFLEVGGLACLPGWRSAGAGFDHRTATLFDTLATRPFQHWWWNPSDTWKLSASFCIFSLTPARAGFWLFFFFFGLFRAAPTPYGGSQGRGLIRAVATGLRHSPINIRSKPSLQPTPRLTATPVP